MPEIGLLWTLLLFAGMVTLVVWLVKLLFPAGGDVRRDARRGTDALGFVDQPHPGDRRDREEDDEPSRGPNSPP